MGNVRLAFLLALLAPSQKAWADDASDTWITTKTKLSLLAEENSPANSVHVVTRRGDVTVFGQVPTQQTKQMAETAAGVEGVLSVRNDLEVKDKNATVKSRQTDRSRRATDSTSPGSTDAGKRSDDADAGTGPSRPTTTRTTGGL